MAYAVSKTKFAQLVEQALDEVPEAFKEYLEEISIEIRDHPTQRELANARVGKGSLLLGLYQGRPRTQRNIEDELVLPDVISIFQQSIQAVCNSELELIQQVLTTVLHEIGHHFGMSESQLDELGYG